MIRTLPNVNDAKIEKTTETIFNVKNGLKFPKSTKEKAVTVTVLDNDFIIEKSKGNYSINDNGKLVSLDKSTVKKIDNRKFNLYMVTKDDEPLTETAVAFLDSRLPRIVFQSIATVYNNSGHPFIFELLQKAILYMKYNEIDKSAYEMHTEIKTKDKQKIVIKENGKVIAEFNVPVNYEKEQVIKDSGLKDDYVKNEFDDLVQQAYLIAFENQKFMHDYECLNNTAVSRLIYRNLNAIITNKKNKAVKLFNLKDETENTDEMTDKVIYHNSAENNNENVLNCFDEIELTSISESIKKFIIDNLSSKIVNKIAVADCWILSVIGDESGFKYSQEILAKWYNVSHQTISKYISYADNVIKNNKLKVIDIVNGNIVSDDNKKIVSLLDNIPHDIDNSKELLTSEYSESFKLANIEKTAETFIPTAENRIIGSNTFGCPYLKEYKDYENIDYMNIHFPKAEKKAEKKEERQPLSEYQIYKNIQYLENLSKAEKEKAEIKTEEKKEKKYVSAEYVSVHRNYFVNADKLIETLKAM